MSVSWCPMLDVWFPMSAVWLPLSNIWCPMSDFWCMISAIFDDWCQKPDVSCPMFDVHVRYPMCDVWCSVSYVRMCDVWCPICNAWIPLSDALRPADVWCAMSDVRFLMSDVRLPLFDVFVYSKLEQNLPGQAKCEPTVVFLVGLSAELYVNAYLCRGNIQWVKANLLNNIIVIVRPLKPRILKDYPITFFWKQNILKVLFANGPAWQSG